MDFEALKPLSVQATTHQSVGSVKSTTPAKGIDEGVKTEAVRDFEKPLANAIDGSNREEKAKEYTEKEVASIIKAVNEKLAPTGRHFQYKVHEVTKQLMIKVVDTKTNEVIKEIPPEKGQDATAKLWELAGILVDEKR